MREALVGQRNGTPPLAGFVLTDQGEKFIPNERSEIGKPVLEELEKPYERAVLFGRAGRQVLRSRNP